MLLSRCVVIRLLHTADWHLGAALHGWSREIEHRAALAQLVNIAHAQAVHGVIIAGDVFDSLNPSADAQKLFYETLRDLRAACPHAAIVLIAGNHDPAARLEAPRALFDFIRVVSIGVISRQQDALNLSHHLIPLHDEWSGSSLYFGTSLSARSRFAAWIAANARFAACRGGARLISRCN